MTLSSPGEAAKDERDASAELSAIPDPPNSSSEIIAQAVRTGPKLTPKQQLFFYSPDEWEQFVYEWARALDDPYDDVKILGGADDRGVDVAAFLSRDQLEGPWDCFQCKHYGRPLQPSDAYPEMLKILLGVVEKHYTVPRKYQFLAPQGCGKTLDRLLSSPSKLKSEFLNQLQPGKTLHRSVKADLVTEVTKLATQLDFSLFSAQNLDDVLDVHRRTSSHAARFGQPLPDRPAVESPPSDHGAQETRYIEQLVEVYREKYSDQVRTLTDALSFERSHKHLQRQREAFYCAEALRVFARDSVPEGTFESLQADVYDAVIEIEEQDHNDGMERLTNVLQAAMQADLTVNVLVSVSKTIDRKGICHQLANEDRLVWCRGD